MTTRQSLLFIQGGDIETIIRWMDTMICLLQNVKRLCFKLTVKHHSIRDRIAYLRYIHCQSFLSSADTRSNNEKRFQSKIKNTRKYIIDLGDLVRIGKY
jgi:hypothetical protein